MELEINDVSIIDEISLKNVKKVCITDQKASVEVLCNAIESINESIEILKVPKYREVQEELTRRKTYQGFNRSILNKVKQICELNLNKEDIAIDMTIGNGYDTLFLGNLCKMVFGFDIQEKAIQNTSQLLKSNNVTNYKLFLESHENIDKTLKDYSKKIKLILFNLGYLPTSDKKIMTNHESTLKAVKKSLEMIGENGIILIVCYPHEEGQKEAHVIKEYLKTNKIIYQEFHNTNNLNAPFLLYIKKAYSISKPIGQ